MRDFVSSIQFKKREKHPWRSVTFSVTVTTKSKTPPWMFFTFFKLYKWYEIAQSVSYLTDFLKVEVPRVFVTV